MSGLVPSRLGASAAHSVEEGGSAKELPRQGSRVIPNQWGALCFFTTDGRVAIDNNRVERQMRCVAVGRKNWLFARSDEGGHRAAAIYPLVCTCGLTGIEPWAYLKDVLQRIAEGCDPAALTPRLWKAARSEG